MVQLRWTEAVGRSQLIGLIAQVTAALPLLLVSVLISRRFGASSLTDFVALLGVAAVGYAFAQLAVRPLVLVERFRILSPKFYLAARLLAALILVFVLVKVGTLLRIDTSLVIAVCAIRVADLAADFHLAIDQVRSVGARPLTMLAISNSQRLLFIVPALIAGGIETIDPSWAFSALAAACVLGAVMPITYAARATLSMQRQLDCKSPQPSSAPKLLNDVLRIGLGFLVAQQVCALLTSAPRLALPFIDARSSDALGAAAATLTVATFVGMFFNVSWLRWSALLSAQGLSRDSMRRYFLETLVFVIAGMVGAYFIGAPITAWAFKVPEALHTEVEGLLILCVPFFALMSLSNVFKFTEFKFGETLIYALGLSFAALALGLGVVNSTQSLIAFACAGLAVGFAVGVQIIKERL